MCMQPSNPVLELKQSAALEELSCGNLEAAVVLLRECAELTESLHGAASLETAQSLFTLALCLFRQQRFELEFLAEVESYALRALSIRQSVKGRIDPSVGITSDFLGTIYRMKSEWAKAEEMFRLSLENATALVGANHINTAKEQLNVASTILSGGGNLTEAKELVIHAIRTNLRFYGEEALQTDSAIGVLSQVLIELNSEERIEDVLNEIRQQNRATDAPSQYAMR